MKKIIIAVLLTAFLAAAGFTQDFNNPQVIEKLGLTPEQVTQLTRIQKKAQKIIIDAQLDIGIHKAEMKKALAQENVSLRHVERLLKSISDLEYEVRLEQIRSQVRAREVIGDEAWTLLNQFRTRTREEAVARERKETDTEPSERPDSKSKRK